MNNFTIKPEKEEQHYQVFNAIDQKPPWVYKITDDDSELKRSIDIKIRRFLEEADCEENTPNFRGGVSSSSRAYDPVPNAVSKGIQRRAFEYTNRISWEGCETFKKELDNLLRDWKHSKELNCQEGAFSRIEYISTVGANIMKIISKLYAEHPRSKEFGENKKILTYTNDIWKICFPKRENKAEDLAKFCKSLGAESERAREKCLSIKFNNQYSGLNQIFLAMRSRITLITEKIRILQYAWYFALLRASVFFPEEILIHNTSELVKNLNEEKDCAHHNSEVNSISTLIYLLFDPKRADLGGRDKLTAAGFKYKELWCHLVKLRFSAVVRLTKTVLTLKHL
ncbi:hypothetical protein BY996DRAFT_6425909 [Phakopsora pachyrhizi]|nr:hypothetical protein BY996DRAFT_6425909 [Phakopsora pachyrhizi]